ncbi:MAG: efflux RND transporter permease subunit [Acidobacteriota bacterium]
MNLTRFALDNRTATGVFLGLLVLAGSLSFGRLPRAEDPGFVIRTAVVTSIFPGASPEQVELLVTDPIEEAIEDIEEIHYVTSESRRGVSVLEVNFLESLSPEQVEVGFDELRETLLDIRPLLPPEIRGPQVDDDFGDVFGTVVAITGDGFDLVELERLGERARAVLLTLDEVSRVELQGAPDQRIFVEYDPARLKALGLSPMLLAEALRQRNIVRPAGEVRSDAERFELEVTGSFESPDELAAMRFRLPSGDIASLGDVAQIRRSTEDPPRSEIRYNGQPAITLSVSMDDGGQITELGPRVLETLGAVEAELPVGVEFHVVSYQTSQVKKGVENFLVSLLQGIGIVLAVTLLTLGVRTGLIVAAVLPLTMVGSLVLMELFGISLNQMSLAALIISLGLLVDSAIVMAESIQVSMREGKSPVEAAIESAAELRLPLLVSSLTTAAALLPTYLAESTTGEYTSAIFEVVTIALLLAWVLSLTMTPLLSVIAARSAGGDRSADPGAEMDDAIYDGPFFRRYRRLLLTLVRHRWLSLAGFVGLLAVSLWAFQFVPQLFFPRTDKSTFQIELELPESASFARTSEVTAGVERFLAEELRAELDPSETERWLPNTERAYARSGVVNWTSFIGSGAPRFLLGYTPEPPRPNYVFILAHASTNGELDRIIRETGDFMRRTYPEVLARVDRLRNGPPLDYPVEVRLSGEDPARLYDLAADLKAKLRSLPGTQHVGDDWDTYRKTVTVDVNHDRARRAGLTESDIALSLETATEGLELTQYREGNDLIPVVLRSRHASDGGLEALRGLDVMNPAGLSVPLGQVAELGVSLEPGKILRRDRQRTLTVQADLDPDADRSVTPFSLAAALVPILEEAKASWPLGYRYELGGEVESSGDAQASIQAKQPIAVIAILSLLVLQFNSLRGPIIVIATLPFTLIGVVGGLVLTQKPFGFMALLGVIALFGVVINNAVVLLDRIETEMKRFGRSRADAVLEASKRRLRPILLTTATTVGGLAPLWIAGGPMFSPMAVAFLFGLVASTLLTLGLVPVLYGILYRVSFDDDNLGIEPDPAPAPPPEVQTAAA